MKNAVWIGLGTAVALAGCAASPRHVPEISYRGVPPLAGPPASSGGYSQTPAALPEADDFLYTCNFSVSNSGQLAPDGRVLGFTPYIDTGRVMLLRNPTTASCLSSGFGWRLRATGGGRQHNGIDLAHPEGGPILAAGDGRVIYAGWRGDYGLIVEIDHGHGVRTMYAHLASLTPGLARNARVVAGTIIGQMGRTGNATGVHVHYEVSVHGVLVDALNWGAAHHPSRPVS